MMPLLITHYIPKKHLDYFTKIRLRRLMLFKKILITKIRFDNYRVLKIHKFPFLVIFKVNEKKKEILVVTIFNTHRNPDKMELK